MKTKMFVTFCMSALLFSCSKESKTTETAQDEMLSVAVSRHCASDEVLKEEIRLDPSRGKRLMEIDAFTEKVMRNPAAYRLLADGSIEIPVHVNVLYRTTSENISNAQIQSQIDVLNEDFGGTNADRTLVPSVFSSVFAGNTKIKFTWDPATGLTRKATKTRSWGTNNYMKQSRRGGIDPTSPTTKLNIWVCTLSNSILGYAQFPGGSSATDGVVVLNTAFGRTGTVRAPFNRGRTGTHEVGHWLNLRHIWGDATCGSDFVGDTPPHNGPNYSCPGVVNVTCTSNSTTNPNGFTRQMTMNYMDYTNDACMYMFSLGQASRMNATFLSGGGRTSFAQP